MEIECLGVLTVDLRVSGDIIFLDLRLKLNIRGRARASLQRRYDAVDFLSSVGVHLVRIDIGVMGLPSRGNNLFSMLEMKSLDDNFRVPRIRLI